MSKSENDPWYAFRDKQTARTYSQDELDAAVAAERERTIEEVLRGLRSENDSTQLRAIITSIEALRPNVRAERGPTA